MGLSIDKVTRDGAFDRLDHARKEGRYTDAEFLGWQEQAGSLKPFPLFNVMKRGHPLYESTVSALTLEKERLKIPRFPSFEEWIKQKEKKL